MLQSLSESLLLFALRAAVRQPVFYLTLLPPKTVEPPNLLHHSPSPIVPHIVFRKPDSAAPSVREVLLSAGTVEGIVTRCERWLEKRGSRPPPNSILRDIVLDSVHMILWVGKSATRPADMTYLLHHLRDHLLKEREELFMENGTVCVDSSLFFPR